MLSAVIFDLDGVLVRTDELHFRSWQAMAERFNLRFDRRLFDQRMRGRERRDATRVFLEQVGRPIREEEVDRVASAKQQSFLELLESDPPPPERGVLPLLDQLKRLRLPLAVGSSSRNARLVLEKLGLLDHFEAIVEGGALPGKPDPAIFLKAAELLGAAPAGCVVLEDAVDGVKAALAAGMRVVAIGPAERFHGLPLNCRVDRVSEVTAERLRQLA